MACSQSFHHYRRQDEAMREALRVLRPDGLYVLSDTGWGGPCAWFAVSKSMAAKGVTPSALS